MYSKNKWLLYYNIVIMTNLRLRKKSQKSEYLNIARSACSSNKIYCGRRDRSQEEQCCEVFKLFGTKVADVAGIFKSTD